MDMNRKIYVILEPFNMNQSIYVFEYDNKIETAEVPIEGLNDYLIKLIKDFNVNQVNFSGPRHYSKGIANNFKQDMMVLNNYQDIEVNLV